MQGVGGRWRGGGIGGGGPYKKNGGIFFYSYPEGPKGPPGGRRPEVGACRVPYILVLKYWVTTTPLILAPAQDLWGPLQTPSNVFHIFIIITNLGDPIDLLWK